MYLNTIQSKPSAYRNKKRLGRGQGSGSGKTCGRGHKGQLSRAGAKISAAFEGGQMPLVRRLPKFGFSSLKSKKHSEVTLDTLSRLDGESIDLEFLKAKNIIPNYIRSVKIIASNTTFQKKLTLRGLHITKGARALIEKFGGTVE